MKLSARSEAFLTNAQLGGDDYFATTAYHDMGTYSAKFSVQEDTDQHLYTISSWEFEVSQFPIQLNVRCTL